MKKELTKLAIADALLEGLNSFEYENIPAKIIYEHAGVSKRTFYNHFRDKFEILPWLWRYKLEPFLSNPLPEYYLRELTLIDRYYRQFQNALSYRGQNNLFDFIVLFSTEKYRCHIGKTIYQQYDPFLVENLLLYSQHSVMAGIAMTTSQEEFRQMIFNAKSNPEIPLRLCALNIFADYVSFDPLPESLHI